MIRVKNQTKLLVLLILLIGCLSATWGHFTLPTVKKVRTFTNMDAVQKVVTKELQKYDSDTQPLAIKYIKTGKQRILLKTSWVSSDYAISDFALSLQNLMAEYDFSLHGRVNLLDNEWKLHLSNQNTILYTIQIANNGTE